MIYFTTDEYFAKMIKMGYVASMLTHDNAEYLLKLVNEFLSYLVKQNLLPENYQFELASGWRSVPYNASIGGARDSAHCIGRAIDIGPDNLITKLCEKDNDLLERFGLYAESSLDTASWSHITDRPPGSGHRIFRA